MHGVQGVAGSNPVAPTNKIKGLAQKAKPFFYALLLQGHFRGTTFKKVGNFLLLAYYQGMEILTALVGSFFVLSMLAGVIMLAMGMDFTWLNLSWLIGAMIGIVIAAGLIMAFPQLLIVLLIAMGYGAGRSGRRRR